MFPFENAGNKQNECIKEDDQAKPYCQIGVDEKGISMGSDWGRCSPGCPGATEGIYSTPLRSFCLLVNIIEVSKIIFLFFKSLLKCVQLALIGEL